MWLISGQSVEVSSHRGKVGAYYSLCSWRLPRIVPAFFLVSLWNLFDIVSARCAVVIVVVC